MRQARAAGQVAFALMTALFLILGARDITPLDRLSWQWLALMTFSVFFAMTYWRQHELQRELETLHDARPKLTFGEPTPRETKLAMVFQGLKPPTEPPEYEATFYQIPVTNEGGASDDVSVRIEEVRPPIDLLRERPVLHLAGDVPNDHRSYRQGFRLRHGETQFVDFVALVRYETHEPGESPPVPRSRFGVIGTRMWYAALWLPIESGTYEFNLRAFAGSTFSDQTYIARVNLEDRSLLVLRKN